MAKYGSNSLTIFIDDSGGTPQDMTQYIDTINDVEVEALLAQTHTFGDAWAESLATGVRKMTPLVLGGHYDDTASVGPDAVLNAPASGPSVATRTVTITWGGSKTTSAECVIQKYKRAPRRDELHRFESTLVPTGTVTEA